MNGVAIIRGKGIPTTFEVTREYESKSDFIGRVAQEVADPEFLIGRNTITIEYVFEGEDL